MASIACDIEALCVQGFACLQKGDFESAEKIFMDCMDTMHPIASDTRLQLLLGRSQCRISSRNYGGARRDCSEALLIDPHNITALLRRAIACEFIGDYESGVVDVQQCLPLLSSSDLQYNTSLRLLQRLQALSAQDKRAQQLDHRPESFVTAQQTLRLALVESLPRVLCVEKEYAMIVSIGNEFGLWNRNNFTAMTNTEQQELSLCCEVVALDKTLRNEVRVEIRRCCGGADMPDLGIKGKVLFTVAFFTGAFDPTVVMLRIACPSHNEIFPVLTTPVVLMPPKAVSNVVGISPLTSDNMYLYLLQHREMCVETHLEVIETAISVDAQCVRCISCQADKQVYAFECPGYLGIGGKVWDATFRLIDYFSRHPDIIRNKRVLELGSGTGLAAIALHNCKPAAMMLTDVAEVVPLLQANIRLNGVMIDSAICDVYAACELEWGTELTSLDAIMRESPEVIVASDVVYEPEGYFPLLHTLEELLARRTIRGQYPVFYMAHRHRNPEDYRFFEYLSSSVALVTNKVSDVDIINTTSAAETQSKSLQDIEIFSVRRKELI